MLNKKLDSDITGQQGSSRRRLVWETEGISEGGLNKVGNGFLTGIGLACGILLVNWGAKQMKTQRR